MRSRAVLGFVLVLLGCNAILGNNDGEVAPVERDAADPGEGSVANGGSAGSADATANDPAPEAGDDRGADGAGGSGGRGGGGALDGGSAGGNVVDASDAAQTDTAHDDSARDVHSDAAADVPANDAFDASHDVPPEACSPTPVTIFDGTPAGTCGNICNPSSALASDGAWAGLDCTGGGATLIDSMNVTACIAADFGSVANLDPVIVRAKSVADACGTACSTYCNTGDEMLVFYGSTRGVYQFAKAIALAPTFNDYPITLGLAARYILVCRDGSGAFRDDVAVDSILSHGACR
jgi:hypothetical protein